jgi:hypothetical protein
VMRAARLTAFSSMPPASRSSWPGSLLNYGCDRVERAARNRQPFHGPAPTGV